VVQVLEEAVDDPRRLDFSINLRRPEIEQVSPPSYPRITPTTNPLPVHGLAAFRRDRFGPGVSGTPNVASSRHTSPTAFAAVTATSSSHAALR